MSCIKNVSLTHPLSFFQIPSLWFVYETANAHTLWHTKTRLGYTSESSQFHVMFCLHMWVCDRTDYEKPQTFGTHNQNKIALNLNYGLYFFIFYKTVGILFLALNT